MAGGAPIDNDLLGVVPTCGLPTRHAVAAYTISCGGNMDAGLARGAAAVMATRAVGGGRKAAVIHIAGRQPCRGFVAFVARVRCCQVSRRLARCNTSVMAGGASPFYYACVTEFSARK